MKQKTINRLLELANTAYSSNETADKYARNAAHEAAHMQASKHNAEYADPATLIASSTFLEKQANNANFSAQLADASNHKFAHERSYQAVRESYTSHEIPIQKATESSYALMLKATHANVQASNETIISSYQAAYARDIKTNNKAMKSAQYVYSHAYCATRTAYIIAITEANKNHDPLIRKGIFESMMTKRLNLDLKYDLIEPSTFLMIMCSTAINVIAGLIVLGGIITIVCGIWGVASLPFALAISVGTVASATGTGLIIGSFFARSELKKIEEANDTAEETNTIY